MDTAELILQGKKDLDEVYEAGKLEGGLALDPLKSHAFGEVIAIGDISPIVKTISVNMESKNILPYPYNDVTQERNGLQFTVNDDGSITVNGAATALTNFYFINHSKNPLWLEPGTYAFSMTPQVTGVNLVSGRSNKEDVIPYSSSTNRAITVDSGKYIGDFCLQVKANTVVDNVTFYPQVEKGLTATGYTPYFTEMDIAGAYVYGKNLLDAAKPYGETDGSTTTITGNTLHLVKGATGNTPSIIWEIGDCEKFVGKELTLSFKLDGFGGSADNNSFIVNIANGNARYQTSTNFGNSKSCTANSIGGVVTHTVTITPQDEYRKLAIRLYMNRGKVEGDYLTVSNVQLEVGGSATNFEPYKEPICYEAWQLAEDSKIDGIYPNTTLMIETVGSTMDVEYIRDFNRVLEAEMRENWNKHIDALNKSAFTYGFAGKGWNDETFTPFTDIIMPSGKNAGNVFAYSGVTDLKGILESYGTRLDCKNALTTSGFFQYSLVTKVPEITLKTASSIQGMFSNATSLVSIDSLTFPENCTTTNAFQNCTSLTEIRIGSNIGNTIDFHWSPLSKESVESIVSALSDSASGMTVTFNKTQIDKLNGNSTWLADLKATKTNWTFALSDV